MSLLRTPDTFSMRTLIWDVFVFPLSLSRLTLTPWITSESAASVWLCRM